ncbi:MAG: cytochrome ubiquinol oxidase subunit I [Anaerolineae bacterium]|nr:cytochrome ubiquinol oxidase subunit I [Anaerolineae bacterium]
MEALDLARLQFAITTVYHFFFVPLTMGLSLLVAIMQTMWVYTDRPFYKRMTKFWGKLFVINFAMGVVTGIVLEFQFGMNWSEYARFMGDIFGAPLAIEALLAFFLESTFLGIWLFGWNRLSRGVHLAAIWLVAIGSNLSALWILIANSFMQQPVGYVINETTGRAEMDSFADLITNPTVQTHFPHVVASSITTAGFFVLGISAWHLLRQNELRGFFRQSFKIGAIYGLIGVLLVIGIGHAQAQHMIETQPMKMAAAEGLLESEDPAGLSLITIMNLDEDKELFSIRIPRLLSFLAHNKFEGEVRGIEDIQAEYEATYGEGQDYSPSIFISYWSFRAMVGAGFLMLALAAGGLFLLWRKQLLNQTRVLQVMLLSLALPYIANSTGWLLTEVGRQPWIVFGELRTEDAVSPNVSAEMIAASLVLFALIYGVLMLADVYLLAKYSRLGPVDDETDGEPAPVAA